MQSTGQASTQAVSLVPIQGSAIMYAIVCCSFNRETVARFSLPLSRIYLPLSQPPHVTIELNSMFAQKFREKLEGWLKLVLAMWPECPATIDPDGTGLVVDRSTAILPRRSPSL